MSTWLEFELTDGSHILIQEEMIVDIMECGGPHVENVIIQTVRDSWPVRGSFVEIMKRLGVKHLPGQKRLV